MKQLLCPIDFSEVSINALEFAVAIAEREASDLVLLNIFTPSDYNKILKTDRVHVQEEYAMLLEVAESKLKAISAEVMKESGPKGLRSCEYMLKSGKIVDVLSELAKDKKYDLIVVGTTGHSAYERKYIGGNAERIIEHTPCSVLCVPENHAFNGINKIVYASDYQEEDKIAIQQLIALAEVLNADLHVLHVSHHNDTIDKAMFEEYKEEMMHFVKGREVGFERVVFRHIAAGLDDHMKNSNADLLVLLSKKMNFLKSMFHRSLIDHLDQFTDYPLLILKL